MQTLNVDQHYLVRVITKTLTLPKHGCIITKSHEQNKIKMGRKTFSLSKHGDIILNLMSETKQKWTEKH